MVHVTPPDIKYPAIHDRQLVAVSLHVEQGEEHKLQFPPVKNLSSKQSVQCPVALQAKHPYGHC